MTDNNIPELPGINDDIKFEEGRAWLWQQTIGYALGLEAGEPVLALPTAITRIKNLRRDVKIAQSDTDAVRQYVDHLTQVHEWLMAEIRHHATEAVAIGQWLVAQARWINEQDDEYSARKAREARAYFDWLMAEQRWLGEQDDEGYGQLVAAINKAGGRLILGDPPRVEFAAPSLPAVDSPEGLRYAASVAYEWRIAAKYRTAIPEQLNAWADRLEREQAEKAKRDKDLDDLAAAIIWPQLGMKWEDGDQQDHRDARLLAEAVLDRFDITPKADRRVTICHVCLGSCRAPANPNQACTWCSGSGEEPHKAGA